ncbi:MAG: putative two-component system sensor kinase, partial [Verrucomicrobiales bacterium]|nr:putative two-component system sensor kinase [Verrucomicrobiales bacterium]
PVHPRMNGEEFPPIQAKFIRFTITKTSGAEPCIDELETYSSGPNPRNVALASEGAKVTGSGSLRGYKIHRLENINDGVYGNGRSWISNQREGAWVTIELASVTSISRIVWGRDREGKFIDRLVTEYRIEVATLPTGPWQMVASSEDREPLKIGARFSGANPTARQTITRFAPVTTTLSTESRMHPIDYMIDVWQTENGLPSNTISSILQTQDGYLWIGTFHGLVRFDGVRFLTFGEADGLPNNPIACLRQAASGDLWIGTDGGGLIRFHAGKFETYTKEQGLAHNVVLSLEEDSEGRIWIGTLSGLNLWARGRISTVLPKPGLAGQNFLRLQMDDAGNLWTISEGNLKVIRNEQILAPPIQGDPAGFTSVSTLAKGKSDDLWFGGANMYIARLRAGQLTIFGHEYGLVPDDIWEVCETRNGDLWIGTASGGISRLRNGKSLRITTQEGLSSNSIRAIFEDREGNVWLGSNGGGLMRLKPRKLATYTTRDGLSHEVIMSVAEDSTGEIWIGSNCGGLNAWRDGKPGPAYISYLLDNACIWSLLPAKDGSLWIGTWGQGLFRKTGNSVVNYLRRDGLSDDVVIALCEDRAGGLWIGTYEGGLDYYKDGTFKHFTTRDGLSANFITCILEDVSGNIWIGTSGGGLNRFDQHGFTVFSRRDGLESDFIRTLYEDRNGSLWIGTGGGGLTRLKAGKFSALTAKQGLKDNVISQILQDAGQDFWLGSNQGIFRISNENLNMAASDKTSMLNIISYGKGDGMESLECTGGFHPAGLRSRDGILWFSTVKGLVRIDPASSTARNEAAPALIEELLVDGQSIWKADGRENAGNRDERKGHSTAETLDRKSAPVMRFGAGARRFEFRFTSLSFVSPEKIRFKWKMEGLEGSWSDSSNERFAQYNSLAPGDYQFRVVASNSEGVWTGNEQMASFAFTVLPAFWQTWWFSALVVIIALGSTISIVRFMLQKKYLLQLERLEHQQGLERERARIAHDIHDDIGASLTLIAFLGDIGQRKSNKSGEVQEEFEQIARTARSVVRSVDQIVWAVNPKNDSLDHLANYLSQYVQDFFSSTSIRCRLNIPDCLPDHPLSAEERHNLLLLAKEAVQNIVKHSGASEVSLRMGMDQDYFFVNFEDNGCGFDPLAVSAPGDGLNNMRERLAKIRGELEICSSHAHGTKISFRMNMQGRARD